MKALLIEDFFWSLSVIIAGLNNQTMGYYLPHKSYLRPRQNIRARQRLIILSTLGITLIAAFTIFITMEAGDTKTALAEVKTTTQELPDVEAEEPIKIKFADASHPVDLAYFAAVPRPDNKVVVKWSTQSEYKNDHFVVEKSENGSEFSTLAFVPSKDKNKLGSSYSVVDNTPGKGMIFYRLKQTCENGDESFIGLEKVNMSREAVNPLFIERVGPMAFDNSFNIGYYSDREGSIAVEIFDKSGNKIYKSYTEANLGYNTCRYISSETLADDEYTIRISNSSGAYVKKIRKTVGI